MPFPALQFLTYFDEIDIPILPGELRKVDKRKTRKLYFETLEQRELLCGAEAFEAALWGDSSWIIVNGSSENKQEIAVSYSKTDTNGNASESVDGIRLTGTDVVILEYSFNKEFTKITAKRPLPAANRFTN